MTYFEYALKKQPTRLFKAGADAFCALIFLKDNPGRTARHRVEWERGFLAAQSWYTTLGKHSEQMFRRATLKAHKSRINYCEIELVLKPSRWNEIIVTPLQIGARRVEESHA